MQIILDQWSEQKCLITDSPGIAIEYIIMMKRPILYLDEHDKIQIIQNLKMYHHLKQ